MYKCLLPQRALMASLFMLIVLGTSQAETFKVSSGIRAPLSNTAHTGFNDRITREAFRRIGHDIEILFLPPARALQDLNDGRVDADMVRIARIGKLYPNIVVVPEKIIDFDFVAISRGEDFQARGWDSLRAYEVGIVAGWKILERNVRSDVAVTRVEDTRQLLRVLANGRIDIAVSEMWQARQAIHDLQLDSITIHQPPVKRNEMFMVLHRKHEALVPRLVAAIREMKKDGTFSAIQAMTLDKLNRP